MAKKEEISFRELAALELLKTLLGRHDKNDLKVEEAKGTYTDAAVKIADALIKKLGPKPT